MTNFNNMEFEMEKRFFPNECHYTVKFTYPESVSIGESSKVWHFCHIMSFSKIGKKCTIGQNCFIGQHVTIGDECKIQNNVSIYRGVTLEKGVFIGPSVVFTNVKYPRAFVERKKEFLETTVKRGVTIGANATIICGVTIDEFAMVGAGAVVTKNVPPHALVIGSPAYIDGWVCKCGNPIKMYRRTKQYTCPECGLLYKRIVNKKFGDLNGEMLKPVFDPIL